MAGFIESGRLATSTLCNEAHWGLLALRLACSPREASSAELLLLTLAWLLVERVINKVYSFQYTRPTRLILAHQMTRKKAMHTDQNQLREKTSGFVASDHCPKSLFFSLADPKITTIAAANQDVIEMRF